MILLKVVSIGRLQGLLMNNLMDHKMLQLIAQMMSLYITEVLVWIMASKMSSLRVGMNIALMDKLIV